MKNSPFAQHCGREGSGHAIRSGYARTRAHRQQRRWGIGILNALFRQEVQYYWPRELSSNAGPRPGIEAFSGPSSARGAKFRGVLASRASEGQGGLSAQGLNRMGSGSVGDQGSWNRSKARAGARGGARADQPRCVRILAITGGSSMAAMIVKGPPHWGQCSRSISNTRLSSRAQLMRVGAEGGGASA
jgi:hypothetical protein